MILSIKYNMNVYKLFPTTVIEFDLRGYPNKNKLLEYMETTHMHNETGVIKGKNTYQSNPNFLSNYKFIDLKNIIQKHINTYTQLLGLNHTHIQVVGLIFLIKKIISKNTTMEILL